MKFIKILVMGLFFLHMYACSDGTAKKEQSEDSKVSLLKAMDAFNDAFKQGNADTLTSMITERYIHTNGHSRAIGKEDWLAYMSKREQELQAGNLEVIEYTMSEVEIEFYGNTAIVTGKIRASLKEKGAAVNKEYRITNIWVNENGTWKRAGFHDGKIL